MLKQLFQTTDGKVFENKEEAQIHQNKLDQDPFIYKEALLTRLAKNNLLKLKSCSSEKVYEQQKIETIELLQEFCFTHNITQNLIYPVYKKIILENLDINNEITELENCLSRYFDKNGYSEKEQKSSINTVVNPIKKKLKILENYALAEFFNKHNEFQHVIRSMIKQSYVMMDFFDYYL